LQRLEKHIVIVIFTFRDILLKLNRLRDFGGIRTIVMDFAEKLCGKQDVYLRCIGIYHTMPHRRERKTNLFCFLIPNIDSNFAVSITTRKKHKA